MSNHKGKFVHSIEVQVRWCDMDDFSHVNNSCYFTYFEMARISWWGTFTPKEISFHEIGPVIINAYCTFFKAIYYPETLIVNLYAGPPGRSSYECYYEILSKNDLNKKYAEGSTKVVWVDRKAEHSVPLPDFMLQQLSEKIT